MTTPQAFRGTRSLRQAGLTLVELMVALVLMLLVAIATVALYNVSSSSYRTVDAGQEMQDNARFAFEVIGQAARSAGYQDRTGPASFDVLLADTVFGPTATPVWRVEGRNGQVISGSTSSMAYSTSGVVNNSDALVIRFFGSTLPDAANPAAPRLVSGQPVPDGTMIDCSGKAIPYPASSGDLGLSAFYVKTNSGSGEPELYCKSRNPTTGSFSETQIVRGVESFQVLYGLDTDSTPDDIPNRWVSADSAWDDAATSPNWNNVVAIRVGMILRGPVGSGQGQSSTATDNELYPMGRAFTCESNASNASCTPETGLKFVAPNDSRLRRAFNATFMVRNSVR